LGTVLKSTVFSIFGFYNWFQISQGAALQGLGGIWSLSVEDQFYMIVMAAAAALIWQKTEKKAVQAFFALYIGFLILSLGVRLGNQFWWPGQSSEMISYSTFPRLWSFGWGGLAALATDSYQTRSHRAFDLFKGKKLIYGLGSQFLPAWRFVIRTKSPSSRAGW
jgi:peptidoglycan/LPS O-acetylase OafA/YrhL